MSSDTGPVWTIVVAAGQGTRFGGETPKQFLEIAGKRVVDWSLMAAATVSDGVVVVMPPKSTVSVSAHGLDCEMVRVSGGASRSASVRRGLAEIPSDAAVILVHDAARPVATPELFERVVHQVQSGSHAVVPVIDVVDTIRHVDGHVVDRSALSAVQTPQGFDAAALRAAHATEAEATDDATLVSKNGGDYATVVGERWNLKVTEPGDAIVVEALLGARP